MAKSKISQYGTEFLVTYGWAIMAILVIIGALAYVGIQNPETIKPEQCFLEETRLSCKDFRISASDIGPNGQRGAGTFVIENTGGNGMLIYTIFVNSTDPNAGFMCMNYSMDSSWGGKTNVLHLNYSEIVTIKVQCGSLSTLRSAASSKNKYTSKIMINWSIEDSPRIHAMQGKLYAKVQP